MRDKQLFELVSQSLPQGWTFNYVPEDEGTDAQYEVHDAEGKDTGLFVQLGGGLYCVNRCEGDAKNFSIKHLCDTNNVAQASYKCVMEARRIFKQSKERKSA